MHIHAQYLYLYLYIFIYTNRTFGGGGLAIPRAPPDRAGRQEGRKEGRKGREWRGRERNGK
jgi:hypothetical protein